MILSLQSVCLVAISDLFLALDFLAACNEPSWVWFLRTGMFFVPNSRFLAVTKDFLLPNHFAQSAQCDFLLTRLSPLA
jgi:hypothetical protein